ncbi:hypothetical protein AALA00_11325 [Lachnospiraceae bacterium 46-15]
MDKNQIKQWLLRYREGKKDVKRLEEELEELDEMQKNVKSIRYSDMPRGGRRKTDLSDYMAEIEKTQERIHAARYQRIKIFQEVKEVIEQLPTATEREVMSYRYLRLMEWEKISGKIDMELRQIYRIHDKALKSIEKILEVVIECHHEEVLSSTM